MNGRPSPTASLTGTYRAAGWRDAIAVFFVAPVLGFAIATVPGWRSANGNPFDLEVIGTRIYNMTHPCVVFVAILVASGVVALISRRLGTLANVTIMAGPFLFSIVDAARRPETHNLLGVEILGYGIVTAFAALSGFLARLLWPRIIAKL
jgi:hypothetical protein